MPARTRAGSFTPGKLGRVSALLIARAYEAGYQAAYAGYRDLSERCIAELKKPRIRLGSVIGLLGAAGIGVVIGSTIP